jgi:hypothetical protein
MSTSNHQLGPRHSKASLIACVALGVAIVGSLTLVSAAAHDASARPGRSHSNDGAGSKQDLLTAGGEPPVVVDLPPWFRA